MLAVVLASRALERYKTLKQILAITPSDNRRYWVFDWEDRMLDWPIFPEVLINGPTWQKIQSAISFGQQFRELLI